jgi:N-methylhydantoinase A
LAILTTEGFLDILRIGRQVRKKLYDLLGQRERKFIDELLIYQIPERVNANGEITKALDKTTLIKVREKLRHKGIESIAICFLHSYKSPTNELKAKELLAQCPFYTILLP